MNTNKSAIPKHIGLILDGNRRWARDKGLSVFEGHRQGYESFKTIVKKAIDKGVNCVSAYIFSTENWARAEEEVSFLMNLAYVLLNRDINELNKEGIKVVWLGSSERLSPKLRKAIKKAEEKTKDNTRGTLALCFNYGGQQEIVDATKKIMATGVPAEELTPETFSRFLYSPEVPPVDLLIRTSGEQRISGYMLYRMAYAEMYFVDKYWPDFNESDLDIALEDYANRQRRYGK